MLENTDINNIRGKHTVLKEVKSREGWLKNSKNLKKLFLLYSKSYIVSVKVGSDSAG